MEIGGGGVDFAIVCFLRKGPKKRNLPASATAEDVRAQKEYVSEGKKTVLMNKRSPKERRMRQKQCGREEEHARCRKWGE